MDKEVKYFINHIHTADYVNELHEYATDADHLHRIIEAYPDFVNIFLENYETYKRSAENMFMLFKYYPVKLNFDIDLIKKVLQTETDPCNIDACLQLLESYKLDFDLDISFICNYKFNYKWLNEYAESISG